MCVVVMQSARETLMYFLPPPRNAAYEGEFRVTARIYQVTLTCTHLHQTAGRDAAPPKHTIHVPAFGWSVSHGTPDGAVPYAIGSGHRH